MDLSRQSNVSAFEYTIKVGHNFSSKEQVSFNFMAVITICSDFGAPPKIMSAIEIKSVSTVYPSICHEGMGAKAVILASEY